MRARRNLHHALREAPVHIAEIAEIDALARPHEVLHNHLAALPALVDTHGNAEPDRLYGDLSDIPRVVAFLLQCIRGATSASPDCLRS